MLSVWIKTAGIILAIAIGYVMKRTGSLPESSAKVLSKLTINVMLPCVFICNLNGLTFFFFFLAAVLWGFGVDLILVSAAVISAYKKPKETVFVMMYCVPGFNISSFALPVAQIFTSDYEVAAIIMFNIPITFFFYVITPILIRILTAGEHKISFRRAGKDFLKNIPAVVSIGMLLLSILHLSFPDEVVTALRPLANANAAVALLAMGILFEFPRRLPRDNIRAMMIRTAVIISAAALAGFDLISFGSVRKVMIIAMFAPLPSGGPAVALTQGYEGSKVAFGASTSLIVSIISMSIVCSILF